MLTFYLIWFCVISFLSFLRVTWSWVYRKTLVIWLKYDKYKQHFQYYLNIFGNSIMEILVSELKLATLIISSCLGGFLLTECICRQDMNIPRSLFLGDSGIFMPTTTVYAWPDINIGAFVCDIAPFLYWKNIIIDFE